MLTAEQLIDMRGATIQTIEVLNDGPTTYLNIFTDRGAIEISTSGLQVGMVEKSRGKAKGGRAC